MRIEEQAASVKTRADFVAFVQALEEDLQQDPESWENSDLPRFLGALARWTHDMDGYYIHHKRPVPQGVSWGVFTDILMAARIYE